jgi:hypothetical protein
MRAAMNDSYALTERSELDDSRLRDFSEIVVVADDYNETCSYMSTAFEQGSHEYFKAQDFGLKSDHLKFEVEEAELSSFIGQLTKFVGDFQEDCRHKLFSLDGKNFTITIRNNDPCQAGLQLSQVMSVKSCAAQTAHMAKAFYSATDWEVYRGDVNCLEGELAALEKLKEQLIEQIEEAKAVKNSYTRMRRRQTLTCKEDFEDDLQRSRLHELTSSPTPRLTHRRTMTQSSPNPRDNAQRDKLEQELKNLELSLRFQRRDIVKSAKIATRISRIKTELQRIRSEDAINTARLNSMKSLGRSFSMSLYQSPSKDVLNTDEVSIVVEGINDSLASTPPLRRRTPSFYAEASDNSYRTPSRLSGLAQQLRDLNQEREDFEDQCIKAEAEQTIQRQRLVQEWAKLEAERRSLESLKDMLDLQSTRIKDADKPSKVLQLCSDFLKQLEKLGG